LFTPTKRTRYGFRVSDLSDEVALQAIEDNLKGIIEQEYAALK
jgi:hypothetical protein